MTRQRLVFGRRDERFPVLVGDVALGGQMVDRARDPPDVLPARSVTVEQLVITEPGEGATDEHERMERVEPGRIERRVTAEWSPGHAPVDARCDVRESNPSREMAIGIRRRDEGIRRVHAPLEVASGGRLLAVSAVCPPGQVVERRAEDGPGVCGVLVRETERQNWFGQMRDSRHLGTGASWDWPDCE